MCLAHLVATSMLLTAAVPQSAPDTAVVVSRFLSAYGGLERLRAFHSTRESGTILQRRDGGTRQGSILLEERAPNLSRLEIAFGTERTLKGFDGSTGWYLFPGQSGPEYADADERKEMSANDFSHPLIDYTKRGIVVSLLKAGAVEGRPAHRLQVTRRDGSVWIIYIDAGSFREVRRDYVLDGRVTSVQHFRGHRVINGVLRPTVYEIGPEDDYKSTVITLTRLEVDPALPLSRFRPPSRGSTAARPHPGLRRRPGQ